MQLNYGDRKISWGNEALIFADMAAGTDGKPVFSNVELVTGLVSVGSMEDQAETNNYPADDVPDHGVKKGATLLQGEIVLIQVDNEVQDFLGREKTSNGLGYSYTGNFKTKAVQYLIKARKRDNNGNIVDGYRVIVYPQMTATAEPTFESETDSVDGVDPIQWTMAVQATASDVYTNNGYKVPAIEYELWGEQAKALEFQLESGLFIVTPDSQIGEAVTLTSPTLSSVQTATTNGNDGTLVLPTTLKDSKENDVPVTYVIKNSNGQTVTNGQLAPGTYTITFRADGYPDVTATGTVTNKPS